MSDILICVAIAAMSWFIGFTMGWIRNCRGRKSRFIHGRPPDDGLPWNDMG